MKVKNVTIILKKHVVSSTQIEYLLHVGYYFPSLIGLNMRKIHIVIVLYKHK